VLGLLANSEELALTKIFSLERVLYLFLFSDHAITNCKKKKRTGNFARNISLVLFSSSDIHATQCCAYRSGSMEISGLGCRS
jgi:hypothetical protein